MNTTTSTVKLRDFRNDMQKYFDAVKDGHSFTIMKRSKPVAQISSPAIDEWGDEGNWKTMIDLRDKKHPNGIPAEEFLRRMEEYKKKH
jgi:prevent-host-death family protein